MIDFFKERNGQSSSTRLIFFIGMLYSMLVSALFTYLFNWGAGEYIAVFSAVSGVFVGLKLGQKPMEGK